MYFSIKSRLIASFFGLAIVPLLAVGTILGWQSFAVQKQQAIDLQQEMAKRAADQTETILSDLETKLRLVSSDVTLFHHEHDETLAVEPKLDEEHIRTVFASLLSQSPALEEITLVDEDGQQIMKASRQGQFTSTNPPHQHLPQEFSLDMASGEAYYSAPHIVPGTNDSFINIAVPVVDEAGRFAPMTLVGEVHFQVLWEQVHVAQEQNDSDVYVLDAAENLVSHSDPTVSLNNSTFSLPSNDGIHRGLSGQQAVLVHETVPLPGQSLIIVVERNVFEALALTIRTSVTIVTLLVISLVTASGLAWLISRQMVRPIQSLAKTAQAISDGDLGQRTIVQSKDEVGILATAFNKMTDQIQGNIDVLEKSVIEQESATRGLAQANSDLEIEMYERKQFEEALLNSEAQQRALINAVPDAMFRINKGGIFVDCRTARDWQPPIPCDEIPGKSVSEILPAEASDSLLHNIGLAFITGETQSFEFHLPNDSKTLDLEARIVPVNEEEVIGIVRDITDAKAEASERLAAAQRLRDSEQRMRSIVDTVVDAIIVIDESREIVSFNPAAERIFGYSANEVMGRNVNILMPEPYHSQHNQYLQNYANTGEKKIIGIGREVSGKRKDGSTFPLDLAISEFWLGGSRMFTGIARDITERNEVSRLKDEFISVVSHELRTPLTSIRGSLGLIASGVMGNMSEKAQHMMNIAVSNTDRLVRLINDILDIERIESGRVDMEKKPCDAGALMAEARQVVAELANSNEVILEVNLDMASISASLWADPDRIVQTLTNLLSNAIKFSPKGCVVEMSAQVQNDQVLFQVKDQGRGIPEDKLESIFGRFQQVDASDSREKGGTGLGLAICRSIVQQHEGKIWVESLLGQGSTFLFTLPVGQFQGQENPSLTLAGPRVLVCDDDSSTLDLVCAWVEGRGYQVIASSSGRDAVKQATIQRPEVICLDLLMPEMDGWKVIETLQQQPETRDIPVIILSAESPSTSASIPDGVSGWLVKPMQQDSLFKALEKAMTKPGDISRVLIAEDDRDLAQVLSTMFQRHGVQAFHARTGQEAMRLTSTLRPDLLVLDVQLPEGDGFEVIDYLRKLETLNQTSVVVYCNNDLNDDERQRLILGRTEFLTKSRAEPSEFMQIAIEMLGNGLTNSSKR